MRIFKKKEASDYLRRNNLCLRGFTFIEAIVVLSIIVFASVSIFYALRSGIKIWKRILLIKHNEDVHIFIEKLKEDLHNAVYFSEVPFQGDSTSLSFPVVTGYQAEVFPPKDALSADLGRIACVRYEFDRLKHSVSRQELDYSSFVSKSEGVKKTVLDNISDISFEYYRYSQSNALEKGIDVHSGIMPYCILIKIVYGAYKEQLQEFINIPIAKESV